MQVDYHPKVTNLQANSYQSLSLWVAFSRKALKSEDKKCV